MLFCIPSGFRFSTLDNIIEGRNVYNSDSGFLLIITSSRLKTSLDGAFMLGGNDVNINGVLFKDGLLNWLINAGLM